MTESRSEKDPANDHLRALICVRSTLSMGLMGHSWQDEHSSELADQCSFQSSAGQNVNIVYVATTNVSHYDDAKMAMEAGKHCLVEKVRVFFFSLLPDNT